jgi:ADP-dependent NAD(P)H-hydrate dehydratase / NAD(P)H-hydrate epimerase
MPATLITNEWVRARLPIRKTDSNKGTHGRVLVIGGCENYVGAPAFAALSAYRVGAGLVTLCVPDAIKPIVAMLCPEATFIRFRVEEIKALPNVGAVLVGPGLGQADEALALLTGYLTSPLAVPHLVDADALNLLAQHRSTLLAPRSTILTPHPGEMARLADVTIAEVQAHREETAQGYAQTHGQVVVLKGAGTLIAAPNQLAVQLPFANPALAVAGTGDVLAGAIAGLLAQGLDLFAAAACGAYVHGLAGERWREQHGEAGLLASDLLPLLPDVLRGLRQAPAVQNSSSRRLRKRD